MYFYCGRTQLEDKTSAASVSDITSPSYSYNYHQYSVKDTCPNETQTTTSESMALNTHYGIGIYLGLTLGGVVIRFTRSLIYRHITMRSSRTLHDQMYTSVMRSPVRFYDANPKGRILNRFSGDIGAADGRIPEMIMELVEVSNIQFKFYYMLAGE